MKQKAPYTLTQYRIDVVVRVPGWAIGKISKGDQVIRESDQTVQFAGVRYRLGESYTKFVGYTPTA